MIRYLWFRNDDNKNTINFILQFRGVQDSTLQEYVYGILIENAPRTVVDGEIAIVVGPVIVYEDSLTIRNATVSSVTGGQGVCFYSALMFSLINFDETNALDNLNYLNFTCCDISEIFKISCYKNTCMYVWHS